MNFQLESLDLKDEKFVILAQIVKNITILNIQRLCVKLQYLASQTSTVKPQYVWEQEGTGGNSYTQNVRNKFLKTLHIAVPSCPLLFPHI